jgi:hypothetical protein
VSELPVSMRHLGQLLGGCLLTAGPSVVEYGPTGAAGREDAMSSSDENVYRGDAPAGHDQHGHAQRGYPPPGHPPPGYPPGYPATLVRPTNTMAILALVFAFVFAPAAIALGVVARRQIRETGEQGDGLALAGIIVGSIFTAFFVLMIVGMIAAFSAASSYGY